MPAFDIAVIRSNPVTHDPRVRKVAQSLSKKYRVIVYAWDREGRYKSYETLDNMVHIKRLKVKAPYNRLSLLAFYPLFWIWVVCNLLILKPKIIHACDFDSLLPSYVFKVLFAGKLVFDSFDRYAMAFIPPKHRVIYPLVNTLEEILASKADALITVSTERLSTFGEHRPSYCEVIMNCPEDRSTMAKRVSRHHSEKVVLVYAGTLSRDRGLTLLKKAIEGLEGTRLFLAGRIVDNAVGNTMHNSNIRYVGLLPHGDALELEASADIIPILYDPSVPINRVASPNKLFEAMMAGVPVISNVCRDIVRDTGCGLIADYDFKTVRDAIIKLRNSPSLREDLGSKGRLAFERQYNWTMMEERLFKLYDQLRGQC